LNSFLRFIRHNIVGFAIASPNADVWIISLISNRSSNHCLKYYVRQGSKGSPPYNLPTDTSLATSYDPSYGVLRRHYF
jgi:hypothetical protein